jgi:hypothetical protein
MPNQDDSDARGRAIGGKASVLRIACAAHQDRGRSYQAQHWDGGTSADYVQRVRVVFDGDTSIVHELIFRWVGP